MRRGYSNSNQQQSRPRGGGGGSRLYSGGGAPAYQTSRIYFDDGQYTDVGLVKRCDHCNNSIYYIALSKFPDNLGQPYFKCSKCKHSGGTLSERETELVRDSVAETHPDVNIVYYPPNQKLAPARRPPLKRLLGKQEPEMMDHMHELCFRMDGLEERVVFIENTLVNNQLRPKSKLRKRSRQDYESDEDEICGTTDGGAQDDTNAP